jgi:hypothetical protein
MVYRLSEISNPCVVVNRVMEQPTSPSRRLIPEPQVDVLGVDGLLQPRQLPPQVARPAVAPVEQPRPEPAVEVLHPAVDLRLRLGDEHRGGALPLLSGRRTGTSTIVTPWRNGASRTLIGVPRAVSLDRLAPSGDPAHEVGRDAQQVAALPVSISRRSPASRYLPGLLRTSGT